MHLQLLDWLIVAVSLAGVLLLAAMTRKFTRSVADFLAANRSAGRYLLTVAAGAGGTGAITIAANFEKFYEAGFAAVWWEQILAPIALVLALSGFVIYRYRETRAMTMAQFFEMRYSRRFRIFAGMLAFASGVLNYGIFPAVTSRFIIYFTGLPPQLDLGFMVIPTMAIVMAVMLSLALVLTLSGGQVAVMITDFAQGIYTQIAILTIFFFLLSQISWGELMAGLQQAPAQQSRLDPFAQKEVSDFNVWFFAMLAFLNVYGFRAWQGSQGYLVSARSPHEAKMAGILAEFRAQIVFLLTMLLPVFVFAMMHLPQFSQQQAAVNATLAGIGEAQLQKQMIVPVGLGQLLPMGLMGLFATVVMMAALANDDTYLHSWGSIFIQDVVMPLRNKPLSPQAHLRLLRGSIIGVAAFAWVFSMLFPLQDYILMYFQVTGAIYLGGAGAVLLGGLYWKRGTTGGAWAALITGSILAVSGIILRNVIWPNVLPGIRAANPDGWVRHLPQAFPLNGMQMAFMAALAACLMYVVVSLLSRKPPMDMDELLHRGRYAVEKAGHHPGSEPTADEGWRARMWRRLGVNRDFTTGDKAIYLFKIGWTLLFFTIFLVGTLIGVTRGISQEGWMTWWAIKVTAAVIVGVGATVWFFIGGIVDLRALLRILRGARRDEADDGRVEKSESSTRISV